MLTSLLSGLYASSIQASPVWTTNYVFVVRATLPQSERLRITKQLLDDGRAPDWKIGSDGSVFGTNSLGTRIYLHPQCEALSEIALKRELFQMRSKETKIVSHKVSELSDSAKEALTRQLAMRFPECELKPDSSFVIGIETRISKEYPSMGTDKYSDTRQASKEFYEKFPYKPGAANMMETNPLFQEIKFAIGKGTIKPNIPPEQAKQRRQSAFDAVQGDRYLQPPLMPRSEQLTKLSAALIDIRNRGDQILQALDDEIIAALAKSDRNATFAMYRRCKTMGEVRTYAPFEYREAAEFVAANWKVTGYSSEQDARQRLDDAPVSTGTTAVVYLWIEGKTLPVSITLAK